RYGASGREIHPYSSSGIVGENEQTVSGLQLGTEIVRQELDTVEITRKSSRKRVTVGGNNRVGESRSYISTRTKRITNSCSGRKSKRNLCNFGFEPGNTEEFNDTRDLALTLLPESQCRLVVFRAIEVAKTQSFGIEAADVCRRDFTGPHLLVQEHWAEFTPSELILQQGSNTAAVHRVQRL